MPESPAIFNQKHWIVEQITVGDRTTRITHRPSGIVAHGRDESEAWIAMAVKLGERVGQLPHVSGDLDFDVEAKRYAFAIAAHPDPESMGRHTASLADVLRQVWNARGAADIAKVEVMLYADGTNRPGSDKVLDQAIRTLDR